MEFGIIMKHTQSGIFHYNENAHIGILYYHGKYTMESCIIMKTHNGIWQYHENAHDGILHYQRRMGCCIIMENAKPCEQDKIYPSKPHNVNLTSTVTGQIPFCGS
jgi:hypothetical protein